MVDMGNGPTSINDAFSLRQEIIDALIVAGFKAFDVGAGLGGFDIWFNDGKDEYFMTVKHSRRII